MLSDLIYNDSFLNALLIAIGVLWVFSLGLKVYFQDPNHIANKLFLFLGIIAVWHGYCEYNFFFKKGSVQIAHWIILRSFWPLYMSLGTHLIVVFAELERYISTRLLIYVGYLPGIYGTIYMLTSKNFLSIPIYNYLFVKEVFVLDPLRGLIAAWSLIVIAICTYILVKKLLSIKLKSYKKNATSFISFLIPFVITIVAYQLIVPMLNRTISYVYVESIPLIVGYYCAYLIVGKFRRFSVNTKFAYEDILASISNILIVTNLGFKLRIINNATQSLIAPNANIKEISLSSFFKPSRWNDIRNQLLRVKKDAKISQEVKISFNNQELKALLTATKIYDEFNTHIGYLFIGTDLSQYRYTEDTIVEYASALEEVNTDLRQYTSIASGEFKKKIETLSKSINKIEKKYIAEHNGSNEFLKFAKDGAFRMNGLLEDLLIMNNLDELAQEHTYFNSTKMIEEVKQNLSGTFQIEETTIELKQIPEQLYGNRIQIIQLFQNLIGNGLKYNTHETPKVEIGIQQIDNKDTFYISDNGIGINPKYHDKIFNIFQRLHTRDKYQGTGIGLAICKKIIKRHNGKVWLDSEEHKGTTFYFTLHAPNTNDTTQYHSSNKSISG